MFERCLRIAKSYALIKILWQESDKTTEPFVLRDMDEFVKQKRPILCTVRTEKDTVVQGETSRSVGNQPHFLVRIAEESIDRKSTRLNSSHSQISNSFFFL